MSDQQVELSPSRSEEAHSAQTVPSANMIYCHGCGKQIHKTARSCPHCGAASSVKTGDKSKLVAALLAFFLGGLGFHRFYLGNILLGIIYLLFCWTFIPMLIAFGECIYFLAMGQESFDRKYNFS
ncbi:zinc-ribbon domain and TM2 domain-containing protein [Halomonas sp. McH1-25]|uniref:TM2 domain-containing protein n=1 Tax=unclassified Halomonas TaxID=2609666 RepID=UPI001EF54FE0|nr:MULTISPECIES: TM2 domain-containing protein [unclassified Halomonas]MCG7598891.1 zinc-ribbon domain and TM2 domain-containing protein [Halomonas sp. McH1-25]MCP1340854.1 zinc-ribbon domain and TM2 domain-containing protein [Halomonas sp. FL8]MCP1361263.1 zinc-ribbon domain and TM2 domain-containing protein [Halomonas sp. BBD45]MCP1363757.1 zinc-ribbon domain and TM2 domain-containing protein [Halomonas sp. BBD48]